MGRTYATTVPTQVRAWAAAHIACVLGLGMTRVSLERVNQAFHESYDQVRHAAKLDGPVWVLLADTLVAFHHGQRTAVSFTPQGFQEIKAVAHAPVAIYGALHRLAPGQHDAHSAENLRDLQAHLVEALRGFERERHDLEPGVVEELRAVLRESLAFLQQGRASEDLEAFARQQGQRLLRLTEHATRIQLAALDAHVEQLWHALSADDRAELQVVVTGDHQARARSLAAQYFRKRLREPEGIEERVTYAEGVSDEHDALALVGTRRVDRAIASAFFGDSRRLQRDILGDAAYRLLRDVSWPSEDG
jgi:hypothetical protein